MTRKPVDVDRNRSIVVWLAVGLIGVALSQHAATWAISYVVGSGVVLFMGMRGWL